MALITDLINGLRTKLWQDSSGDRIPLALLVDQATSTPVTSLRVSAGPPGAGQTAKTYTGKQLTSATLTTTVTLETVTAGKTFYVTDLYMSYDDNAVHDTRVQAAGVDIFRAAIKGDTAPVQLPGMETQPVATTGQVVTILLPIIAAAPSFYYFVSGFEI